MTVVIQFVSYVVKGWVQSHPCFGIRRVAAIIFVMDDLRRRILSLFDELNQDTLDLHTLFEAGGNDPQAREQVFDAVQQLVTAGLLEERGSDFYSLTTKGQAAVSHN